MSSPKHDSPKYSRYYTAEEVAEIFASSQATVDSVREWLVPIGIPAEKISQSVNKQWMSNGCSSMLPPRAGISAQN
jgi:tripeptidyl-peptidase-1